MRRGPDRPTMKGSDGTRTVPTAVRTSGVDALDVDDARVLAPPDEVADEHLALGHRLVRGSAQVLGHDPAALGGVRDTGVQDPEEGREHRTVAAHGSRVFALEQTSHLGDGPIRAL